MSRSIRKSNVSHPAAAKLVKRGFFKGIKSYAELKAKISKLRNDDNTKVQGDAFEVFFEAYLKVIKNLKEVIPAPCFTDEIKRKYHYPEKMPDAGADGLYLSHNGQWTAYQAKFRSNQKTLTWAELATFFGLTEYTPMRHVVTTCQEIVASVDEMKGHDGRFFSTREEDFEKLTKEDFKLIADFLEGETVAKKPYKLRNYQRKAVTNIVKTLKNEPRTYVSMACGTGKTLVAIKAAAKMDKKNVVIFVPSLALLKQIYDEVIEHDYNADTRYLAICSDEKIKEGEEGENVKITDLDFPATTDVDVLRKQMRGAKKTVVFCTYQSAQVLVSLHKKFDLGIFDEAHKTVGKDYKLSATALFDDNIKITKRLFLTATPKFYPSGGADYVAMDNEQVYGRRCFDYPFSQAKEEGWITPFKIVVSVITSEDVDRELLNQTERGVRVGSDDLKAVHVANQLAFKQAAEKYSIKHTFSFHNSCLAARRFTSDSHEGIKTHIEDIQSYHVNGDQSSGERKRILNDFAASKFAIVSNAKCLTEGVDVPAVDCVAFIQPKKSTVDIVQAIGRAMRPYKGKEYGYLFVPLYIEMEEGETFEEAAQRTDYSQIIEVARAMADHDDGLRDMLRTIITTDRIPPGGNRNTPEELPFDPVGESIDLGLIRASISTRIVESFLPSRAEMVKEFYITKLEEFHKKHGHCRVNPFTLYVEKWEKDLKLRLEQRGFKFRKRLTGEKAGHTNDTFSGWSISYKSQIRDERSNKKNQEVWVDRLRKINYDFRSGEDQRWEAFFIKLSEFQKEHGHVDVPSSNQTIVNWSVRGTPVNLATWVSTVRAFYRNTHSKKTSWNSGKTKKTKAKLTKAQIRQLNKMNFNWSGTDAIWMNSYRNAKSCYENTPVGTRGQSRYGTGYGMVWKTKNEIIKGKPIGKDFITITRKIQKKLLQEIGVDMTPKPIENQWMSTFNTVKKHKNKTGKWPKEPQSLQVWMSNQRKIKRNGKMSKERIKLLNSIKFPWSPQRWPEKKGQ